MNTSSVEPSGEKRASKGVDAAAPGSARSEKTAKEAVFALPISSIESTGLAVTMRRVHIGAHATPWRKTWAEVLADVTAVLSSNS